MSLDAPRIGRGGVPNKWRERSFGLRACLRSNLSSTQDGESCTGELLRAGTQGEPREKHEAWEEAQQGCGLSLTP